MKRHPHDEVIRAYLDGKVVQYRHSTKWQDVQLSHDPTGMPAFYANWEWRIKPEDPDVWVSMSAWDSDQLTGNPVCQNRGASFRNFPRLKMKLSEYKKLAQLPE